MQLRRPVQRRRQDCEAGRRIAAAPGTARGGFGLGLHGLGELGYEADQLRVVFLDGHGALWCWFACLKRKRRACGVGPHVSSERGGPAVRRVRACACMLLLVTGGTPPSSSQCFFCATVSERCRFSALSCASNGVNLPPLSLHFIDHVSDFALLRGGESHLGLQFHRHHGLRRTKRLKSTAQIRTTSKTNAVQ